PQRITDVQPESNWRSKTKDAWPFGLRITRQYRDGTKHFFDDIHYKEPVTDLAAEMHNPHVLDRANRVERIGRRIKTSVAAAGALSVAALITISAVVGGGSQTSGPSIEACSVIADGTETLVPVLESQISSLQKAGETVCKLATNDYLALTPVTTS
ncbi:MAG TPA: hypothetical protein VLE69_04115, partial [Candidatus Saccharimonadales bacterium]|nr:hypothetical protein [Candidatus Saccharimonadales bacterium]